MADYVFDLECNGFNPDRIYCVSLLDVSEGHCKLDSCSLVKTLSPSIAKEWFNSLTSSDRLIGHSITRFDIVIIEKLLGIKVKAKLIDTLALSWYLFPKRNRHGLEDWGVEFGIPKPPITDWENLTIEEYEYRCEEDVKINSKLWYVMRNYLMQIYDNHPEPLLDYLEFKMGVARLQEEVKWSFDIEGAKELLDLLETKEAIAVEDLRKEMPDVKKYRKVSRPKKPYKKDGTLSAIGEKWKAIVDKVGFSFDYTKEIPVFSHIETPKPTSHQQIKDWLFTLGWKPTIHKYVKKDDGSERSIPQIRGQDGELCKSIERLLISHPELIHLKDLGVISHRKGLVNGLINDCIDGEVIAKIQGLTNTLRFIHKTCVNIPSLRKPYGKEIRGLFKAREGLEFCGSDMCSLEDRTKQHYMWKYDSDYVKDMMVEGWDAHIDIAVESGLMTKEEEEFFKWYKKQN